MKKFVPIVVVLCMAPGCGGSHLDSRTRTVTMAELEQATANLSYFTYLGSDIEYHHFLTQEGKRYLLPLQDWSPNRTWPLGQMQVFVKFKDGEITLPNPRQLSDE